jgi:circadian clock protein KaiB
MSTHEKKETAGKKKRVPVWQLHLYVAGTTARSVLASGNLQRLCDQYLKGHYKVTVIDIVKEPDLARAQEILATPTLVRAVPGPQKTVIGCLSDTERVLKALQMDSPSSQLTPLIATLPVGHA